MSQTDELNLDAPSSPEQLDRTVRITSPLSWLAVALLGLVAIAVVAWSVLGELPSRSQGLGFVVQSDLKKYRITSQQGGQVEEVHATLQQDIKKGDLLFTLSGRDVEVQLDNAKKKVVLLHTELERVKRNVSRRIKQRQSVTGEKNQTLRRKIKSKEKHLAFLDKHLKVQEAELKKGLIIKSEVEKTRTELSSTQDDIANFKDEISSNQADLKEYEDQQQDSIHELAPGLQEAQANVQELTQRLSATEQIRSPADGRLLEISTKAGDNVAAGGDMAIIELTGGTLIVRGYLPLKDAQQVRAGMPVQVAISSLAPEIYGTIRGTVDKLSQSPIGRAALMDLYENADLVDLIMDQGPPYAVDVALKKNPNTPSGFEWSTSDGPPLKVASGSLANASIIYETRRPIEYVLPIIGQLVD